MSRGKGRREGEREEKGRVEKIIGNGEDLWSG